MRAGVWFVTGSILFMALPLVSAPDLRDREAQLKQLFADEWEYELRESPELATSIGDYRYNDRWSDGSLSHVQQEKRDLEQWLGKFQRVDSAGLGEQETLSL